MPLLDEEALKKQIKDLSFEKVYFLYGEELYLKEYYKNQLLKKVTGGDDNSFNLHFFEGKGLSVDELADAVESFPLMAEKKCVVVTDFDYETAPAADKAKIKELLSDLPDHCVLIFWLNTVEIGKKNLAKWKGFLDLVKAQGAAVELAKKSESALVKLLISGADKRGCAMPQSVAAYMVSLCGNEMVNLLSELEKVCAFTGSGEVQKSHVDAVCIKTIDAKVYDLSKAVLTKNADQAFSVLDDLAAQRESMVSILSVLSYAFVDLYRAKVAELSGVDVVSLSKDFDYKGKEFRLKNAARDCKRMNLSSLRECLDILAEADYKLKSARMDDKIIVEEALSKLLIAQGR